MGPIKPPRNKRILKHFSLYRVYSIREAEKIRKKSMPSDKDMESAFMKPRYAIAKNESFKKAREQMEQGASTEESTQDDETSNTKPTEVGLIRQGSIRIKRAFR